MVTVPFSRKSSGSSSLALPGKGDKQLDWTQVLIAGTLVAGGAMIVTGHKRAGVALAAAGASLALLEDTETVKAWWKNVPGFLAQAQHFIDQAEHYAKEATVQGRKLQGILRR